MIKRLYSWFGSLVDALDHAHSMKVVHRDVKPANILIKNNWPFLSDFGCARDFTGQDAIALQQDNHTSCPAGEHSTSSSHGIGSRQPIF